jgi:hypothetical protein
LFFHLFTPKPQAPFAMNKKATSARVASRAAQTLSNPNASATAKTLAASALSQKNKGNQTGAATEDLAAKVLASPKYNEQTKEFAASVLAQSVPAR